MPQINLKELFAKVDRKRLLVAAIVAGVAFIALCLLREKPRSVEEAEWDSIVFPEMAGSPVRDMEPPPADVPSRASRRITPLAGPEARGLQIEVAANAALRLEEEWRPDPKPALRRPEVSLVREPTRLEGGIEPIDAPAQ